MPGLDRFSVGAIDAQQVMGVGECGNCHSGIYRGEWVVEYEMEYFCDQNCLSEYLLQNIDFTEVEAE